jgi:deoxyribodipyrimidine photo-lyase
MEAFPTDYQSILQKIDQIDPIKYGKTRNYIDGAVTYLSPYISRGVISTNQVLNYILEKGYRLENMESFVKELCWRDYFQRVAQHKNVDLDIKNPQSAVSSKNFPKSVLTAQTGILAIDQSITKLYASGYMHNHERMYLASIICNIAQYYWNLPSKWMYYHLLDGDFASNSCSWQWVAGANSSKKYYANQENINKYTNSKQKNSYLDVSYEEISEIGIPDELLPTTVLTLHTELPKTDVGFSIDPEIPTFIYNWYNLDFNWHKNEKGNRVLLVEPSLFQKYPISNASVKFLLDLGKNIPNIQVFVGSFEALKGQLGKSKVIYKEHPLNEYQGIEEPRKFLTALPNKPFNSFFGFWKHIEKSLRAEFEL